jgi:hypothetical protein
LRRQRGRHHIGAILDVEPRRDLDLFHLFARRDADADQLLDRLLLLFRRMEEVGPHYPVPVAENVVNHTQAVVLSDESPDHRRFSLFPIATGRRA